MSDFTSEPAVEAISRPEDIQPEAQPAANVPMAWHRFLTRFYLWAAALYHIARAALMFTGLSYHSISARDAVYAGLPGMRILDFAFGGMVVLGALMQIISARMLHKKQAKGPRMLAAAYIVLLLAQAGYGIGRYVLTKLTPFTGGILGVAAVCIGMLVVNGSYYKKRKDQFHS